MRCWVNWAWRPVVPWLELTTTNPPLAAGVFYCLLDFLVMTTLQRYRTRGVGMAVQGV